MNGPNLLLFVSLNWGGHINAVKQVVKIFENSFTVLISERYKFLEGPFASRTESIKPPKNV